MLHLDALNTIRDCVALLKNKKHRIVGKLLRDIVEVIDLSILFWEEQNNDSSYLNKWYSDKVIPHRKFRDYLEKAKRQLISKESAKIYNSLSVWTHHTYLTLKNSYSLGGNDGKRLVCDSNSEVLMLPQTIALYMWEIKDNILYFLSIIKRVGLIDWEELRIFLNKTIKGMTFI